MTVLFCIVLISLSGVMTPNITDAPAGTDANKLGQAAWGVRNDECTSSLNFVSSSRHLCHLSCHSMSHHFISCHVTSCHIMLYHVMLRHVISYHVISYHVISCYVMSYHVISCYVMLCHIMSCHGML